MGDHFVTVNNSYITKCFLEKKEKMKAKQEN